MIGILQAISNDTEMILHSSWRNIKKISGDEKYCVAVEAKDNLNENSKVDDVIDHKLQTCLGLTETDYSIARFTGISNNDYSAIRMIEFNDEEAYTLFKLRYTELD